MLITQDALIKTIAEKEQLNIATVRTVFRTAEELLFTYLSSATPEENTQVKLLDGLSLECSYVPERQLHTYKDMTCRARLRAKPKITRYYNRKLNHYFDKES